MAADKRLSYKYDDQGTIHCELLVHERGSWVNLPVYKVAHHRRANGSLLITGYVESLSNQKFRALLTYNLQQRRTALWHLQEDILCSTNIDGRKKPVCEYTIRKSANDNPVDLTSIASAGLKPFANVPSQDLQCFSWRERDPEDRPLPTPANGDDMAIDIKSSLRFTLQTCKILRTTRDKSGRAAFPTTEPSDSPSKNDRHFEPSRGPHERLSHYVHIEEGQQETDDEGELVPEFEPTSCPFVEFCFYYKSRELHEKLGINSGVCERPRRGIPASKSAPDVSHASASISATATSNSTASTSASQPTISTQKRTAPPAHPASAPHAATSISDRSPIASTSRQARHPSPELSSAYYSPSFKPPKKKTLPLTRSPKASHFRRVTDRDPTPFHRPFTQSTSSRIITSATASTSASESSKKRPAQQPASPERPHKKPTKPKPNTVITVMRAALGPPTPSRPKEHASTSARVDSAIAAAGANDQFDTSSLPSPPASPEPGVVSDSSLPSLDQIFGSRSTTSPQRSSTSGKPLASSSSTAQHTQLSSKSHKGPTSHSFRTEDGRFKAGPKHSPTRTQTSTSGSTVSSAQAAGSPTPKKTAAIPRPPLVPGVPQPSARDTTHTHPHPHPVPASPIVPKLGLQSPSHEPPPAKATEQPSQSEHPSRKDATPSSTSVASANKSHAPTANGTTHASKANADQHHETSNAVLPKEVAPQTPTAVRVPKQEDITPTPTPSAPMSQAPSAGVAQASASASASTTSAAPPVPATPKRAKPAVRSNVIDLTLESDEESESDTKRIVKADPSVPPSQSADDKLAGTPSAEDSKAEVAGRKSAYKNAEDFLNSLDIGDTGNVVALVSMGYKSTESFLKRLPLIDKDYRKSMAEDLAKEMGRVDYGILLTHLKQKGVDFGY